MLLPTSSLLEDGSSIRGKSPNFMKANRVLGRDYSKEKIMNTLGIEPAQLSLAEQEIIERTEELFRRYV
jgi:hypothetical protein